MIVPDGSGNAFIHCSDGAIRWGRFGASGAVFCIQEEDGPKVMLQKRSPLAHEGGTWSCAGGALDWGEDPLEGALREAEEEVGAVPPNHVVLGEYVFMPADDWTYTTAVVQVGRRFGESMNFETDAVGWFTLDEVEELPLHKGFAAAWPHLKEIVAKS